MFIAQVWLNNQASMQAKNFEANKKSVAMQTVVVAKQLVTSQGIPGQVRAQVQTDEYFYHNPFYDVINRRFIGFSVAGCDLKPVGCSTAGRT